MSDKKREALSSIENINSNFATHGKNKRQTGIQMATRRGTRGKMMVNSAMAEKSSIAKGKATINRRPVQLLPHVSPLPVVNSEPGTPVSRAAKRKAVDGAGDLHSGNCLTGAISNRKENQAARASLNLDRPTFQATQHGAWPTGREDWSRRHMHSSPRRQLTYHDEDTTRPRSEPRRRASIDMHRQKLFEEPGSDVDLQQQKQQRQKQQHDSHALHPPCPPGIQNLGNTCYMNATLQVLLGLTTFVEDLKAARPTVQDGNSGVRRALLNFVQWQQAATRGDKGMATRYAGSPEAIKRCLEKRHSSFAGSLQQDSHEFLAALLEQLHIEVLRADSAHFGGATSLPLTATSCPTSRNFSFCVEHQVTCQHCSKMSCLTEQYRDLSLEVPMEPPGVAALDLQQLLADHLKDETVHKSCEVCGDANRQHSVRHRLRRLPRILTLHLKRFQAMPSEGGKPIRFSKLHSRVAIPKTLQLHTLLADAISMPLPEGRPLQQLLSEPSTAVDNQIGDVGVSPHAPVLQPDLSGRDHDTQSSTMPEDNKNPVQQRQREAAAKHRSLAALRPCDGTCSDRDPLATDFAEVPGLLGGALESTFDAMVASSPPSPLPRTPTRFPSSTRLKSLRPRITRLFASDVGRGRESEGDQDAFSSAPTVYLVSDDENDSELQQALQDSMMMTAESCEPTPGHAAACRETSPSDEPHLGDTGQAFTANSIDAVATSEVSDVTRPGAVQQPLEVYHITEPPLSSHPSSRAVSEIACESAYELMGVVNHLGMSSKSGHFTAHVKEPGSAKWFLHNDTTTTLLHPDDNAFATRQKDCYMLFYQHCKHPAREQVAH